MRFLRDMRGAEITEIIVGVGLIVAAGSVAVAALMGGLNGLANNVSTFLGGLTFTNPTP